VSNPYHPNTELMLYTTEEGGDWRVVRMHSVVVDGMRWDTRARIWAHASEAPDKVWKRLWEKRNEENNGPSSDVA
jgi:hypothetical protein